MGDLDELVAEEREPPTFLEYAERAKPGNVQSFHRWQEQILFPLIQRLSTDRGVRVLFHAPPQFGKSSWLSQRAPAYLMGVNPKIRVALACSSIERACAFGAVIKYLMAAPEYLELFPDPGCRIPPRSAEKEFYTAARLALRDGQPSFQAMGLQSGFVGRGIDAGHVLIIDDPYASAEEARSEAINGRICRFWPETAAPRVDDEANVVVMFHRWTETDIAGMLLEEGGWEYIRLPALLDENEDYSDPTNPSSPNYIPGIREPDGRLAPRRPLSFLMARKNADPFTFLSLFQGTPRVAGGNFYKEEWFRDWELDEGGNYVVDRERYRPEQCWIFQTIDTATSEKTSADWTVVATWLVTPRKDLLLLHVERFRETGPVVKERIRSQCRTWNPAFIAMESNGIGMPIIQDLLLEGLPIRGIYTHSDKVAKAYPMAARYMAGKVYHPAAGPKYPWLAEWIKELTGFPNAKHDDQVDCASLAGKMIALPNSVFDEFSPALHVGAGPLPFDADQPILCGWAFEPQPAWVVAQEHAGQLRVYACLVARVGQGVYDFAGDVSTFLHRNLGRLDDLQLHHTACARYCGDGTGRTPHANAARILAIGDGADPWAPERPGWGWTLLPAEDNRETRDETVRTRLNTIKQGVPALQLDPRCGELIDALSGGYAYRTQGGQVTDKIEANSAAALVEALGCVTSNLFAVIGAGRSEDDEYRPFGGTASGAGRRGR